MIYIVETFQLTAAARQAPDFPRWLQEFNDLVLAANPAVDTIDVYTSYTGAFTLEIWFGMADFAAIDRSNEAEQRMFADARIAEEFTKFVRYMEPVGRKIMRPFPG